MSVIRVNNIRGGEVPNMEKGQVHQIMADQYLNDGNVRDVQYKDFHVKGITIFDDGFMLLGHRPPYHPSMDGKYVDNCDLIDTTWGSHVKAGQTVITSAMIASNGEQKIPLTILRDTDFYPMLENHPELMSELALTLQVDHLRNYVSERKLPDGTTWLEPSELTFFLSYYTGRYGQKPKNRAKTVWYQVDELLEDMEKTPEQFSGDLRYIAKNYARFLVPFRDLPNFNPFHDTKANEYVQLYDASGNPVRQELRKEVHEPLIQEWRETGTSKEFHWHVLGMIRRKNDYFFLAERSDTKKENAGLKDKPVGGHVGLGDNCDTAIVHELNDELGIAGTVLTDEDFEIFKNTRPEMLKHQAVARRVDTIHGDVSRGRTLQEKLADGTFKQLEPWDHHCHQAVYEILYDGPIEFKDGEATGVLVKGMDELEQKIKDSPDEYSNDLPDLIRLFRKRGIIR